MKTEIKNGTVFDGIIKIEFFYRWRPIYIDRDGNHQEVTHTHTHKI
jgi:hypothetical protein